MSGSLTEYALVISSLVVFVGLVAVLMNVYGALLATMVSWF